MSVCLRRRLTAGSLVLLACVASLVPTPAARAGTFTQILCADPVTGAGVIPDHALPDGMGNPSHYGAMGIAQSGARCQSGGGITLTTGAAGSTGYGGALTYRAPADLRFRWARLHRYFRGSDYWGLFVQRNGAWESMYGGPSAERCDRGSSCTTLGTDGGVSGSNRTDFGANEGEETNGFNLSVLCESPSGGCGPDGNGGLRLFAGAVTLEDTSNPQLAGAPTGRLVSDPVLAGSRGVTFNATDTGAGIYRAKVLLDGDVKLTQIVDGNSGRCADANPENADPYQFVVRKPCKATAGGTFAFDTTQLPDGSATLGVVVEDAAGNTTPLFERDVVIDNIPAPTSVSAPSIAGTARRGSGLAVTPGVFDDHGAPGGATVTRIWQRCRVDGSACEDIAGATGTTRELTTADLNRRLRVVETATSSEGSTQSASALTARVLREDGTLPSEDDGVDNDCDGTVDEAGEPGACPGGGGGGGGTSVPGPGDKTASSIGAVLLPGTNGANGAAGANGRSGAAGADSRSAVNGEGASPRAKLTVAFARGGAKGKVRFRGKGLTASGRLLDEAGRPIRGAVIDIAETPALKGARPVAARPAVTGADGTFTYAPATTSGSRSVAFAYRYQREGAVVAQAALGLTVSAGVKLAVKLRGITATYSGRVLAGAMPRGGKLVIVQGRAKGGSWQTFASRRAGRNGTFKGRYRLKIRRPGKKLQFRVRVLSESGWNYGSVTSKAVTRTVR